jgi:SAM-dependent methyltransferase
MAGRAFTSPFTLPANKGFMFMSDNGKQPKDWGKICVITRLEKMVENQFVMMWSHLITKGLRPTDTFIIAKDRPAHMAANDAVRTFLKSDCDTAFYLDSDADIGVSFLEEFRSLEDEWEYDILQGFYTRRGWPPEAIWFKRTELGDLMQCLVWKDNHTEDTAMVGLHNTLIRREVFETLKDLQPEVELKDFSWFYYPRNTNQSEDGAFSNDAINAGFRVGSTTKMKSGHIGRMTSGWETYRQYLDISGINDMWQSYYELVEMVADFTGESYDTVIAKSIKGWEQTRPAYERHDPQNAEEHRAFFGADDNGYLYDLLSWNVSPGYNQIIAPLKDVDGKRVLVVGAGLGSEVEILKEKNFVDVFEIPGILQEFLVKRFGHTVRYIHTDTLPEAANFNGSGDPYGDYDLIVAIDVIEHFHPDEFEETLDAMLAMLKTDGMFYLHNNFREHECMPQAFDLEKEFDEWCSRNGIIAPDAPYGYYQRKGYETLRVERLQEQGA